MSSPMLAVPGTRSDPGDDLWAHCRNGLGIARLLVHERRPEPFVATACRMAVEAACRLACDQAGLGWEGDARGAFLALGAPEPLCVDEAGLAPAERLALAERRVSWLAGFLRSEVPGRSWPF